jgi:hypothetical protein
MEMPKPGPEHEKLICMVGTWVGEEIMHPSNWDPKGGTAQGIYDLRAALGGFAVIGDYEQRRGEQVTFSGHGIYRYDRESKQYECHWFDSMGGSRDLFRGSFEDDKLCLISKGPLGWFRLTWDLSQPGRFSSTMEQSSDGESFKMMFEAVYQKSK